MSIPSLLLFSWLALCPQDEAGIDRKLAGRYLAEADAIAERDDGELWGRSLAGPMLFADRCTRQVVANRADSEGQLRPEDGVFVGVLPPSQTIANTATRWAGVEWTMLAWPLPTGLVSRQKLLAHEMFHRIQDEMGFPARNPSNEHLEGRDGRLWLRLEWRALAAALRADGEARHTAVADAIAFRRERHRLRPEAAEQERQLEMNEGLAEYTGYALCGKDRQTIAHDLANLLDHLPESDGTLMRSFAYTSGPAYGWLLDAADSGWRHGLTGGDELAARLGAALELEPTSLDGEALWERAKLHEGERIRQEEDTRREEQERRRAELTARYVEGPALILPLTDEMRYSFNPRNLEALGEHGTFYPTLEVTDAWGVLTVEGGALMTKSPRTVRVTVPTAQSDQSASGEGWQLTLKAGWKIREREEGSFEVTR